MKTRIVWLLFGVVFFVTLAIIVGQRLSAEAMAVVVGVMAGVAASIPTSLIVVWMATRAVGARPEALPRPAPEGPPAEPRIVVVAPQASPVAAGYGGGQLAWPAYAAVPRRFTVVGGAEVAVDCALPSQEAIWPQ